MKVTAHATRAGDWWAVEVPEVDGVYTQAKRLDQVAEMVADAVALLEDVDPATVEVAVRAALGTPADAEVRRVVHERVRLDGLQSALAADQRELATQLVQGEGLSLRDAGLLLGISFQRVGQLVDARPKTARVVKVSDSRPGSKGRSRSAKSGKVVTTTTVTKGGKTVRTRTTRSGQIAAKSSNQQIRG